MATPSHTQSCSIDNLEHIYLESSSSSHNSPFDEQRRYPRTCYTDQIPIRLRLRDEQGEIFEPFSLLVNESFGGMALLVFATTPLSRNQLCEINFFREEWSPGRIVWSKVLDESVQEIGLTYRF
ncbi:MAG: hypothetical protein AB4058_02955 [Microcystaceae cyanobacterium]